MLEESENPRRFRFGEGILVKFIALGYFCPAPLLNMTIITICTTACIGPIVSHLHAEFPLSLRHVDIEHYYP